MYTVVLLLAGLFTTADRPATPIVPPRVALGPNIRVVVPPLQQAGAVDRQAQQQVFAFYLGLFR